MTYVDITDRICQLTKEVRHDNDQGLRPMYSFNSPAHMLWNSIANGLVARGWTEEQVFDWLQSKSARWALDGDLGEAVIELGMKYAANIDREER
jgi:hypothetical protein